MGQFENDFFPRKQDFLKSSQNQIKYVLPNKYGHYDEVKRAGANNTFWTKTYVVNIDLIYPDQTNVLIFESKHSPLVDVIQKLYEKKQVKVTW